MKSYNEMHNDRESYFNVNINFGFGLDQDYKFIGFGLENLQNPIRTAALVTEKF
jgi:hypothetical protein